VSLYDTIAAQLASVPAPNFNISPAQRFGFSVAAAASPNGSTVSLAGLPPLRNGDALLFEQLWALITPTAAMSIQGMFLNLVDASTAFLATLSTPITTTLGLGTTPTSLWFPPPPLITMADLLGWQGKIGVSGNPLNQPLGISFTVSFSASTLAIVFAGKVRTIHGLQEG